MADDTLAKLLADAYGPSSLSTSNVLDRLPPTNPLDDARGYLAQYMRRPENSTPPSQQQWNALAPPPERPREWLSMNPPPLREHMPATLADFLFGALQYAPMALPASRMPTLGNGLRPQDFATAMQKDRQMPMQPKSPWGWQDPVDPGLSGGQVSRAAPGEPNWMDMYHERLKDRVRHSAYGMGKNPNVDSASMPGWNRPFSEPPPASNANNSLMLDDPYTNALIERGWDAMVKKHGQPDLNIIPGGKGTSQPEAQSPTFLTLQRMLELFDRVEGGSRNQRPPDLTLLPGGKTEK